MSPMDLTRREFLKSSAVAMAGLSLGFPAEAGTVPDVQGLVPKTMRRGITDTNIHLGRWPVRRLPLDVTEKLVKRLRALGVNQAWAGTYDGAFHKDVAAANERLTEECRRVGRGFLLPFGTLNPRLPAWDSELARCQEEHRMPGIRLYPGYHDYTLNDDLTHALLKQVSDRGLILQLVIAMEDERAQHPRFRVPAVDLKPLTVLLESHPGLRVILLNWWRSLRGALLSNLARTGQVYFDIATLEGVAGISTLLKQIPAERILFGSHAPFFYPESAVLKLQESDLSADVLRLICSRNAEALSGRPVASGH